MRMFEALLALIALALFFVIAFRVLLAFFEPGLDYEIAKSPNLQLDSKEFLRTLEALCDARINKRTRVEALANGEYFYEAELEAIRGAKRSINLEAYIFQRGQLTRRFVDALAERARAGVVVNAVFDAIGSLMTTEAYLSELIVAGGRVAWYHPLRWHTWPRLNNRTHRELLIVDGEIGFVGGAGFADQWLTGHRGNPRWRDTMFRIEGEAVSALQSTFVENWLEASGEILYSSIYFPFPESSGDAVSLVVNSSPSVGLSTRARLLYQSLIASAQHSIDIATPYFLPDCGARKEFVRAIRERGVRVRILTPGHRSDHILTRRSSRRLYGQLLKSGARIFEYQPAMMHAKLMIVDQLWSVIGSANFDNRSFTLNDEVNLAVCDPTFAQQLREQFESDLSDSREVIYKDWLRRPVTERFGESLGWLLERQQ
jgi:cardiolipin synthase